MFRVLIVALALGPPALAQNPPATSSQSPGTSQEQEGRILKIFPSFGVVQDPNRPFHPLTRGEKFHIFVRQATDPFTIFSAAADAGLTQAADGLSGYGQGAAGYGKRLGAAVADSTTGEFFKSFAFPALLHHDPRYFRTDGKGFKRRFGYAISRTLVSRTDEGTPTFNYSEVFGTLASASLSNAYYPQDSRGVGKTFARTGLTVGTDAAYNLLNEFGPDLKRKFLPKKRPSQKP